MHIQHLAAFSQGGAAVAARRLHKSLRECGAQSHLYFGDLREAEGPDIAPIPWTKARPWQLWRQVRRFTRYMHIKWRKQRYLRGRSGYFSLPWRPNDNVLERKFFQSNLIHLHWIARTIDLASLFQSIPQHMPVVWTFHDMNPITGGCHHSDACSAFMQGCGACPMLRDSHRDDLSRMVYQSKLRAIASHQVHAVTPSRWLERLVRNSAMMNKLASVHTIPNGIETSRFFPIDSSQARKRLGIPLDAFVVGYSAASLTNKRKGIDEFIEVLQHVDKNCSVIGLLIGKEPDAVRESGVRLLKLGYLSSTDQLAEAYSAMDVYVSPTHAEILGQSILEAMACETPVVAFDVGGVSESIVHQETGLLCPLLDIEAMSQCVQKLANNQEMRCQLGRQARRRTQELFDVAPLASRHLQLYSQLVES